MGRAVSSSLERSFTMGITRSSFKKRRATGGKRPVYRKKRKFELGRAAANTRLGTKRVREVRVRGGHTKYRALRLEHGNFSWGSEAITRRTRVLDVVYNSSNNELVRTKTLVKNAICQVDATPFRQWYSQHYGQELGKKAVEKEKVSTGVHEVHELGHGHHEKVLEVDSTVGVLAEGLLLYWCVRHGCCLPASPH